ARLGLIRHLEGEATGQPEGATVVERHHDVDRAGIGSGRRHLNLLLGDDCDILALLAPEAHRAGGLAGWEPEPTNMTFSPPLTVPTPGSTALTLSPPEPEEHANRAAPSPTAVAMCLIPRNSNGLIPAISPSS